MQINKIGIAPVIAYKGNRKTTDKNNTNSKSDINYRPGYETEYIMGNKRFNIAPFASALAALVFVGGCMAMGANRASGNKNNESNDAVMIDADPNVPTFVVEHLDVDPNVPTFVDSAIEESDNNDEDNLPSTYNRAIYTSVPFGFTTGYEYMPLSECEEFVNAIHTFDTDAEDFMNDFCTTLGLSEKNAAQYLIDLCDSPEFGNGDVNPYVLYALVCQESGWDAGAKGDYNKSTSEYEGIGLGQIHKIAVDSVNKKNGTDYKYSDRKNPYKSLEMITLLLKNGKAATGNEIDALAKYNTGSNKGTATEAGQNYVNRVLGHIGGYLA